MGPDDGADVAQADLALQLGEALLQGVNKHPGVLRTLRMAHKAFLVIVPAALGVLLHGVHRGFHGLLLAPDLAIGLDGPLVIQPHNGADVHNGGVNTFPDLEKKADILENAAMCFQALGYETINAACICGAEQVNPKIQSTVDADALAHMTDRWAKYHMNVCGPVALDLAVSPEACRHKHYSAPGAGMADILLVPNYEVGNGIGKAASLFGGAKNAGVILGARVPIVLVSRSDSAYSKLASIAAGSVLSRRMHLS